jgi:hypothetical protein
MLAGVPVSVAACASIVVLLAGSSGSGVNVAAAAYAASAPYMAAPPAHGVLETVTLTHILRGPNVGATLRQQEWVQTSERLRRELDTITGPGSRTALRRDWAFAPGKYELWSSGREAGVLHRIVHAPPSSYYPVHPGIDVEGQALDGVQGIERYRALYSEGHIRVVGQVHRGGRLLWKLESTTGPPVTERRGRLVFLIDPHTFVPVIERQIDLALPGRPAIVETELLSYRVLAAGSGAHASVNAHKTLFDLAAQHPAAKILIGEPHLPPPPAHAPGARGG